ncbi:putative HTH-type transcriptional regulator [Halolactibacillus miurensis]|uniref:DNA-binding transcriptional regulator, MurR/RpiR family, contains HTH and SIS domains n=1 Tax=Halolactibacillus miurensis TaxID=306541 RepID=A0A1I6SBK2_9BACI|nr:MurR/RpiR family transcriptional regulator [Halolactibacillus miurensis]GEM03991.1 putative HTH-type transcriptional regulator [Halolactibacillus miurensis]SFS74339.1 DNA-binding transcriptional regulator, MurR/RpiR family, contains HTH and SIS domains [Halolactibacillus miurensis]
MEIITIRLKTYREEATTTEQAIIDFVLAHPQDVSRMTIYALSEATFTSPSSIIRLCKRLGFSGFKGFSKALLYELAVRDSYKAKEISDVERTDALSDVIHKVTHKNMLSLEETGDLLDESIVDRCLDLMMKADRLVLFGIGASLIVAKDAQLKFTRINKMAYVNEDWHTQLLMAKNMNPRDLAIVISYSGQTDEMVTCLDEVKRNGARAISITKFGHSPIADKSDLQLYVAANEYSFRSGAMSSRIAQLNLVDILYTAYVNKEYEQSLEILEKTQIRKGTNEDGFNQINNREKKSPYDET